MEGGKGTGSGGAYKSVIWCGRIIGHLCSSYPFASGVVSGSSLCGGVLMGWSKYRYLRDFLLFC